jgi:hypothetical protein
VVGRAVNWQAFILGMVACAVLVIALVLFA